MFYLLKFKKKNDIKKMCQIALVIWYFMNLLQF